MLKFLYNTENKYLNISNKNWIKKLKQKIFFLKVWAKNVGVHYTQQNTVISEMFSHIFPTDFCCLCSPPYWAVLRSHLDLQWPHLSLSSNVSTFFTSLLILPKCCYTNILNYLDLKFNDWHLGETQFLNE